MRIRAIALAVAIALTAATPTFAAPVSFSAFGIDDSMDLHGDPSGADLVLFVGGNQWFVLPALLAAFQLEHPEVKHIFYETLPPGVLTDQLTSGGLQIGALELHVQPDAFLAGPSTLKRAQAGGLVGVPTAYVTNALALLVARGNPKHVMSLADLGRPDVRVVMPNPMTEGVALQIESAYRNVGGARLDSTIMVAKARAGSTRFTDIHHRQTPLWLLDGSADVGPVWYTEALYQQRIASGLQLITIPDSANVTGTYAAAVVTNATHPAAGRAFVAFLTSPQAQAIYQAYGFSPPPTKE